MGSIYTTKIRAIDRKDGELKEWAGPNVEAISWGMADMWLEENGLGYCEVDGVLIAEIDENTNDRIDYDFSDN